VKAGEPAVERGYGPAGSLPVENGFCLFVCRRRGRLIGEGLAIRGDREYVLGKHFTVQLRRDFEGIRSDNATDLAIREADSNLT
jgi:hypothetical protein